MSNAYLYLQSFHWGPHLPEKKKTRKWPEGIGDGLQVQGFLFQQSAIYVPSPSMLDRVLEQSKINTERANEVDG
jgi:hypothetical protein